MPGKKRQGSKLGSALRFIFVPSLGREARHFGSSFQTFLSLLASSLASGGLIERDHVYLKPGAAFTIGDLFSESLRRVQWRNQERLPQTLLFVAIWGLLAFSVLWMVTAVFAVIVGATPAHAESVPTESGTMFTAPSGDLGVSYINNLFSGDPLAGMPASRVIQEAFRSMLSLYSSAILLFASFILLYHIINLLVKAAWDGKALQGAGQIWAPLRLVLAIGMLVPVADGLNAAQLIVIKVAKMGSGLASYAWHGFVTHVYDTDSPSNGQYAISIPNVEDTFKRMVLIHACKAHINDEISHVIAATTPRADPNQPADPNEPAAGRPAPSAGANCGGTLEGLAGQNTINVGPQICRWSNNPEADSGIEQRVLVPGHGRWAYHALNADYIAGYGDGGVGFRVNTRGIIPTGVQIQTSKKDLCGQVQWPRNSNATTLASATATTLRMQPSSSPPDVLARGAQDAVNVAAQNMEAAAALVAKHMVDRVRNVEGAIEVDDEEAAVNAEVTAAMVAFKTEIEAAAARIVPPFIEASKARYSGSIDGQAGWASAGAYFMSLAAMQGAIATAFDNWPSARLGPIFSATDESAVATRVPRDSQKSFLEAREHYFSTIQVRQAERGDPDSAAKAADGNMFWDAITAILPITMDKAFFTNMLAQGSADPFGTLFRFGQTLYHVSLALVLFAVGAGVVFGFGGAGTILMFALYLFSACVPLAFLLPLLPATRFLIAVFSWLGAIFEAVVGMPMMALAFLNPQGDTLVAPIGKQLNWIFSIALKPLFIIFGLIAALLLSTLGIAILNSLYTVAIEAMWGSGKVLFTTAFIFAGMYAFQAYGICNTCFTVIDEVPDRIYQWFGGGYDMRDYDDKHLRDPVAGALLLSSGVKALGGGLNKAAEGRQKQFDKQRAAAQGYLKSGGTTEGVSGRAARKVATSDPIYQEMTPSQRADVEKGLKGGLLGSNRLSTSARKAAAQDGHEARGAAFRKQQEDERKAALGRQQATRKAEEAKKEASAARGLAERTAIATEKTAEALSKPSGSGTRPTYADWLGGMPPKDKAGRTGRDLRGEYDAKFPSDKGDD